MKKLTKKAVAPAKSVQTQTVVADEKTQVQKILEFAEKQSGLCTYENSSYKAIAFMTSEKRKKPIVEVHDSKNRPAWCVIADVGKAYQFAKQHKMICDIAGVVNGKKTWRLCAKIMLNGTIADELLYELIKVINGDEKAIDDNKKAKVKQNKANTTQLKTEKVEKAEKQQKLA